MSPESENALRQFLKDVEECVRAKRESPYMRGQNCTGLSEAGEARYPFVRRGR